MHLFLRDFVHVFVWGCQELKNKILIKNKKLKPKTEAEESVDEGEDEEDDEEEEEKERFWSPRKAGSKMKVSKSRNIETDVSCLCSVIQKQMSLNVNCNH